MKKLKTLFLLLIVSLLIIPFVVKAENNNDEKHFDESNAVIVNETVKYLKIVTVYENVERDSYGNIINANVISSDTYELTKEEFEKEDKSNTLTTRDYTTVEANYRIMRTTLSYSNGTYRYKNQVSFTSMPSVRAFDVIGIGHYSDVTNSGSPYFNMEYYTQSGTHFNSFAYTPSSFSTGKSATFTLPLPNLSSLTVTYYFDVQKVNSNSTIHYQVAAGDYAHGIDSTLTLSQALNHTVDGTLGIVHSSSVASKFDSVNEAEVYWTGTW